MISITRLPQAKKNLERDLKRVYDSVYERMNPSNPLKDKEPLFSLTEEELLDRLLKNNNEGLTDEEILELKERARDTEAWKALYRFICLAKRLERYLIPFPKVGAAMVTFSYDLIVRGFLFSNWRWKDEEIDLNNVDLNLSSDDIYQVIQNVNPDVASVFISKLENCTIADKEILQEALESGQKEVFIDKLKTLSTSDFNSLVLISTLFQLENALISDDWETLQILLCHIDFEDGFLSDVVSILPTKEVISLMDDDYWEQVFNFEDNPSEEEGAKRINAACDKMESNIDLICRLVYGGFKYRVPKDLDTYKLFPFERKYVEDILNDPAVKSILDELPENPDEVFEAPEDQEQHKFQQSKTQPLDPKIGEEGKPDDMEYVPHWPSDEELLGYDDNDSDSQFFTNTIFGSPGNVKASDVEKLLNILISLNIIKDELDTKLIFLARYSGKRIPHLELKRIEWRMLDSKNREKALGYMIMKTAGAQYAKGADFFYYEINGKRALPDKREMGSGAHALNMATRRDTTRIEFEHELNKFLSENWDSKKG